MKAEQVKAMVAVVAAVAEAIRELKQVPSGTLYAHLMGKLSLEQYESIIRTLVGAGLVKQESHLLTWIA